MSGTVLEAEAKEEQKGGIMHQNELAQIKHRIGYLACPRNPRVTGALATVAPRARAGAGQAMALLFSYHHESSLRLQIHEQQVLVTRSRLQAPRDWRRGSRP